MKWPSKFTEVEDPCNYFMEYNENQLKESDIYDDINNSNVTVISFSHFLPRVELLPPRMFIKKSLPWVTGSIQLETQLRKIESKIHMCGKKIPWKNYVLRYFWGHTHYNVDKTLDGVKYIMNALGHYKEQKTLLGGKADYSPKLVFDSDSPSTYCTIM